MRIDRNGIGQRMSACLLGFIAYASWGASATADSPPRAEKAKPKVNLQAGRQEDADAAAAVMEKFLGLWSQRKHEEAAMLVAEPLRKTFADHMPKRNIEFQSVDDVRLSQSGQFLIARVHASIAPSPERKDLRKQEIGLDMILQDGKWWVTKR
jgi:hypothetical protein